MKYRRGKNGQLCRVKLLPEAVVLIEKYKDETRATLFRHPLPGFEVVSYKHQNESRDKRPFVIPHGETFVLDPYDIGKRCAD